jgi:hypothetical protein
MAMWQGEVDDIVKALTTPLTDAEKNPLPKVVDYHSLIPISADSMSKTIEKLNQTFLDNKWTDAFPIVPPTKEALDWMLTGTSRPRDEVLGKVQPKYGVATVEKVAINAVMAGAKPEYLPIIISAVEAVCTDFYTEHLQASTGGQVPMLIINGPIIQELGMNFEIGFLGDGFRPNSTIGRAFNLCMINLGHSWTQINDQCLTGRPEVYAGWVVPENERDTSWEPLHVEAGYKAEQSTVTVAGLMTYHRMGPGGAVFGLQLQEQLQSLALIVATHMTEATTNYRTSIAAKRFVIAIPPSMSRNLKAEGWSKEKLKQWIWENARLPWENLTPSQQTQMKTAAEKGTIQGLKVEDAKPGGSVPAFIRNAPEGDHIHIVVAGGEPAYTITWGYPGPHTPPNKPAQYKMQLITGATLTKSGRG